MSIDEIELGDNVLIRELEYSGRVVGIVISFEGIRYDIRYFHNGDAKQVYFFEDELRLISKNPEAGDGI